MIEASGSTALNCPVASDLIPPRDAEAFALTAYACEQAGWAFRRVGVPATVLAANVRWLSRYRHPRCAGRPGSGLDAGLLATFAMDTALLAGAQATGDRLQGAAGAVPLDVAGPAGRLGVHLGCAGGGDDGQDGTGLSRPRGVLAIGDRVVIGGVSHVLVGVSGTATRLASADGAVVITTVSELLAAGNVAIPGAGVARRMPVVGVEGLPQEVLEAASWWERHIVEVLYGLPPDAPAGSASAGVS